MRPLVDIEREEIHIRRSFYSLDKRPQYLLTGIASRSQRRSDFKKLDLQIIRVSHIIRGCDV